MSEPLLAHLNDAQAIAYAGELRKKILEDISQTGGHLASNLGTVELTTALHRVFDTSHDRLVFDVGHQCYSHKIITGRGDKMHTLRQFGGLSGFPKPHESEHDAFIAGHASTAVSTALGMARARSLLQEDYNVIALFGDGAMTGGLAYEGLCDAGSSGEKLIVILNDNGMSIAKNVGGLASLLAKQRLKPQYLSFKKAYRKLMGILPFGTSIHRLSSRIKKRVKDLLLPSSMFEGMGFTYLGPVDGHDVSGLTKLFRYASDLNEPVFIHLRTIKGAGFTPAVEQPEDFHGVSPFSLETGLADKQSETSFSDVFSRSMCELSEKQPRLCVITAAMEKGTGLQDFHERFPDRFFDVGIAEGHAVTMAAGLAKQGMIPVFAVYSTFLQRSYDMLIHDVALLRLHVIFAIDRAGLVGEDGETHHGVFDVAYLDTIPGMTVLAPASFVELEQMLRYAVEQLDGPVAIRYPRGGACGDPAESPPHIPAVCLYEGQALTLVGYGTMIGSLLRVAARLEQEGYSATVVKLNHLTPLDSDFVLHAAQKTGKLMVVEEVAASGSVAQRLGFALAQSGVDARLRAINLGDTFTTHGSTAQLYQLHGLDEDSIYQAAKDFILEERHERKSS